MRATRWRGRRIPQADKTTRPTCSERPPRGSSSSASRRRRLGARCTVARRELLLAELECDVARAPCAWEPQSRGCCSPHTSGRMGVGGSAPPQGRTRGRSFPFDQRRSFWPSRPLSHTVSPPTCLPVGPQSGRRSQRPWSLLTAGPRRPLANVLGSPRGNVPSAWPGRSCAEQASHGSARSASGR